MVAKAATPLLKEVARLERNAHQGKPKKKKQPAPKVKKTPVLDFGTPYAGGNAASKNAVCVKFSEQSDPLLGSNGPGGVTLPIALNPGDVDVFTRLPAVARMYNLWRFKSLRMAWVPLGSAFAANNQTGEVIVNLSADPYISMPNSVHVAASRRPRLRTEAWEPASFTVSHDMLRTWRYVRDSQAVGSGDARLTDILCTYSSWGTPNAQNIGYIEFSGEVELVQDYTPNSSLVGSANAQIRTNVWAASYTTPVVLTSGVASNLQLSLGTQLRNSILSGASMSTISNTILLLQPGTYRVNFACDVDGTTITTAAVNMFSNGPSPFAQIVGGGVNQLSGSTFSAVSVPLNVWGIYAVAEGDVAGVTIAVTLIGTGTLRVTSWELCVIAL